MMKKLTLKKTLNAILFASLVITAPVTMATPYVNDMLQTGGINGFQDQDRDRILRASNTGAPGDVTYNGTNYDIITSGAWEVGDVFQAVLQFDTVDWLNNAGTTINSQNLSSLAHNNGVYGYSEIKIDTITDIVNGGVVIGQELSFSGGNILSDSNVLVELYEVNPDNLNIFGTGVSANTAISTVRSLDSLAEFGILGNDFWTATVGTTVESLVNGYGNNQQAAGVSGLSIISNAGLPIEADGVLGEDGNMHDLVGNASAFGSATNGWLVNTNSTVFFKTTVPEPSSLALMGIAALMFGGMSTRRRKV